MTLTSLELIASTSLVTSVLKSVQGDDLEGELHRLRADVDGLAGGPACAAPGCALDHHIGIGGDALTVGCRARRCDAGACGRRPRW